MEVFEEHAVRDEERHQRDVVLPRVHQVAVTVPARDVETDHAARADRREHLHLMHSVQSRERRAVGREDLEQRLIVVPVRRRAVRRPSTQRARIHDLEVLMLLQLEPAESAAPENEMTLQVRRLDWAAGAHLVAIERRPDGFKASLASECCVDDVFEARGGEVARDDREIAIVHRDWWRAPLLLLPEARDFRTQMFTLAQPFRCLLQAHVVAATQRGIDIRQTEFFVKRHDVLRVWCGPDSWA